MPKTRKIRVLPEGFRLLPETLIRERELLALVPMGRTKLREGIAAGTIAIRPVKLGAYTVAFKGADVLAFLANLPYQTGPLPMKPRTKTVKKTEPARTSTRGKK
ncbi:MAG: hypothetical protein A2284_13425 [Deltaproteobacteria bacterium RIFOXYA12_FULL_61_11]|nr:MAG: hypothetical protein A2284_13425 [Deltaproteobacteria bacterium RIFOXYA12_FULL_61_11]